MEPMNTHPADDLNNAKKNFYPLELVPVVLSIYVLGALSAQTFFKLPDSTNLLLNKIDSLICIVFIYDFFARFFLAPKKLAFLKWGWIDLVSSIPMLDILRWGRLVRVIRVFRTLRAFRSTKILLPFIFKNKPQSILATVAMVAFLLTVAASIAVLNFETLPESNIKTPGDAIWWAFVSIATVGGDKFPVTIEGRIVAVILFTAGIGLVGTFTAYVATSFLGSEIKKRENEIDVLRQEIKLVGEKVESLENILKKKF